MDGGTATAVRCTNQMAMLCARGRPWMAAALLVASLLCPLVCPTGAGAGALEDRLREFSVGAHRGGFWSLSQSARSDFASSIANGADLLEIDLRWTKDGDVVLYAEFKDDEVIGPALALAERYGAWDRIYFQANAHYDRYARARELAPRANLQVNASDMDTLRWALQLDDPYLVVIALREQIQTQEAVALVHQHGKLASANSWRPSDYQEFFTAGCDRLFAMGVDIVITNNVRSCIAQRAARQRGPDRSVA